MFWNNTSCIVIILEKRLLGTKPINMEGTRPIVMNMEGTRPIVMNMEGTRPNAYKYGGHPAQCLQIWRAPGPCGASPTQPYKCGQYFKVKVNVKAVLILILTF